jgi:hypothetical protein
MKKLTFSIIALVLTHLTGAAAVDLGSYSSYTPYDRYMSPVKRVLNEVDGSGPTFDRVRKLMREGRRFRYSFTEPYLAASPEVTAATRSGDCKAKSLWLIDQLDDSSVRYVIGKARRTSKISHAWVMWEHQGRWWILDCTNTSVPIPADRVSSNQYIPFYSYSKQGTFRHAATQMYVADTRVAQNRTPVASNRR